MEASGELTTQLIGEHGLWLIPVATTLVGGLISGIRVFSLAPEAEAHGTDTAAYARLTHRPDEERHLLLIIGMAACLSATFRSPIGTAIFAIEVLNREMEFETGALPIYHKGSSICCKLGLRLSLPCYLLFAVNIIILSRCSFLILISYIEQTRISVWKKKRSWSGKELR